MASSRSLRARAVIAVLLMAGFYVLAFGIIAVLLGLPYAEYLLLERVEAKLLIFSLAAAATIFWGVMPRIDRFEPPGPRLSPGDAPELFAIIDEIAAATNQPKPAEVYLLADVNAFVSQRGGLMGIGSRRVMGVGLALLVGLSRAELRAVVAHEFGHYVSGDVALGPWIFKTRLAIARTLDGLAKYAMLQTLFAWYWQLFMRITMKVSREQEFVADATAARVAGVAPAISVLQRVQILAPAFHVYASQELMPVLDSGFMPPIVDGFARYMNDPDIAQGFRNYADSQAAQESGEFDTHPPMAERLAALAALTPPAAAAPDERSTTLLPDPERYARALLDHRVGVEKMAQLEAITWEDVGAKVWVPVNEHTAAMCGKAFGAMTVEQIPGNRMWFMTQGKKLDVTDGTADFKVNVTILVLSRIIGALLAREGWRIEFAVGKTITWVKDGRRFNPAEPLTQLSQGVLSSAAWAAQCASIGLSGIKLASRAPDTRTTQLEVA